MKTCSFFGHRDTPQTEELKERIRGTVERLIVEEKTDTFLFGSRSQFDELCHIVVTELKELYPYISRIAYLCKHETACLVGIGMKTRQSIRIIAGQEIYVGEYEEIRKSNKINSAGKACYIERNQWIICDSDFVIIRNQQAGKAQKKSGTNYALEYAIAQEKEIIYL